MVLGGSANTALLPEDVNSVAHGSTVALQPTDGGAHSNTPHAPSPSSTNGSTESASVANSSAHACGNPEESQIQLPSEVLEGSMHANAVLPNTCTRATLCAKLCELVKANNQVRPIVLQSLQSLLLTQNDGDDRKAQSQSEVANIPVSIQLPSDARFCLRVLAHCVGNACGGISDDEATALLQGQSPLVGPGSIGIVQAATLVQLTDAVAALTCEALCADASVFDSNRVEDRPHKAEVQAALEISALLEGSQRTAPSGGGKKSQLKGTRDRMPKEIASLPQVQGLARDALSGAQSALRIELNSGLGGEALSPGSLPYTPSRTVASTISTLAQALTNSAGSSERRARYMLQQVDSPPESVHAELQAVNSSVQTTKETLRDVLSKLACEEVDSGDVDMTQARLDLPNALFHALEAIQRALAVEAFLASLLLHQSETQQKTNQNARKSSIPALGRGTATLRDWLSSAILRPDNATAHAGVLVPLFDPQRSSSLHSNLEKLKSIIEASAGRRTPKLPKGTRDFWPEQMAIRERAFRTIKEVFKRHGAVELDTPVFELRETLMGKYGEDSKLIYDLADQGGELLSLRFDLTVPFARYLAMHNVGNIKRYHIAKVYRRDNPQMSKGRFREFYQCDFDIAGSYGPMVADSEVIQVFVEVLRELDIGNFKVKVNDRRLLDSALEIAGVPQRKFRTICSSIDKLDKQPWSEVRREIVSDKGLAEETADAVYEFVKLHGSPEELLKWLQGEKSPFKEHTGALKVLDELDTLFKYLKRMGSLDRISFDLSMARGLDYYTGVIYEAALTDEKRVGSIGGGGRYDNLVGMFSNNAIPAVGASIGIERVFNILEEQEKERAEALGTKTRATATDVQVVTAPGASLEDRMELCAELWKEGIRAEYTYHTGSKPQKQLSHANDEGIPLAVIIGGDDKERGVVQLKDLSSQSQEEVPRADIVPELRSRVAKLDRKL